jgi:glycerol-3-phosphate dehydrogenase (NAD(P)+)
MNQKCVVAVIGGGSFGTVLANIISSNGYVARLWLRDKHLASEIKKTRVNKRYLPGLTLHSSLDVTDCLKTCLLDADIVLFAIPSKAFYEILCSAKKFISLDQYLITTAKGIEVNNFLLMSQMLESFFPKNLIGVISGPNLAREIATTELTGTVVASKHQDVCRRIKYLLQCDYFRVDTSDDCCGVELAGALKNIYAIAAGLGAAIGFGENKRSMLITKSLAEMSYFAVNMGANPLTFLGLAGIGDLMVTCMSPLSRNYRVGYALGSGDRLSEILKEFYEVAEGINTLRLVKNKAENLGIEMPLASSLHDIIYDNASLDQLTLALKVS